MNNVETQLQKAIEMKGTVEEFASILTARMDELYDRLQFYVSAGFPEDIARTYVARYYTPNKDIINDLSRKMLTDHVDFLNEVISDLTTAKNR